MVQCCALCTGGGEACCSAITWSWCHTNREFICSSTHVPRCIEVVHRNGPGGLNHILAPEIRTRAVFPDWFERRIAQRTYEEHDEFWRQSGHDWDDDLSDYEVSSEDERSHEAAKKRWNWIKQKGNPRRRRMVPRLLAEWKWSPAEGEQPLGQWWLYLRGRSVFHREIRCGCIDRTL